jgi:hypothetical protein
VRFNLSANEVSLSQVSQWVNPNSKKQPWYRLLSSSTPLAPSILTGLRASGKVSASRLIIRDLALTHVSANVNLDSKKLRISQIHSDMLNGKQRGEWQLDFSTKPASYAGSGTLTGIALGLLAPAKDAWIAGTADCSYEVTGTGSTGDEFWRSAEGAVRFEMRDGTLPHISLGEDAEPLQVGHFNGSASLRDAKLELEDGELDSPEGLFRVSGTASLGRELDLKLERSPAADPGSSTPAGYAITGTVTDPRVVPLSSPETRAQLKP